MIPNKKFSKKRLKEMSDAPSTWFLWTQHEQGNLKPKGYTMIRDRMLWLLNKLDIEEDEDFIEYNNERVINMECSVCHKQIKTRYQIRDLNNKIYCSIECFKKKEKHDTEL